MTQENRQPRAAVLTDADLESLRKMLAEHPCRYPFTSEQAATLVEMADNITTAKKISFKLIVTAFGLTVLGWVGKGFIQWIVAIVKTGEFPK